MNPTLKSQLARLGFVLRETGGGCVAYVLPLGASFELWTIDASGDCAEPTDAIPVSLCLMSTAHSEALTENRYATGAELAHVLSFHP